MPVVALTSEQEEVVNITDGCHLVVAPPGSGKTEVLAQRIVRLLQRFDGQDFNILALTFTKNAATSMKQRTSERLGDVSRRVHCTTYHSFCLDVLRHYGHLTGIPPELTVYNSVDDRIAALVQGLTEGGFVLQPDSVPRPVALLVLDEISRAKRRLSPAEATSDRSLEGVAFSVRDGYRAYELALQKNGAVDFDGVLVQAYRLVTEQPRVARHYRLVYKYVLIDEAQDTSLAQYEILKAIFGSEHGNVFMVADPAQSIYGFTGASSIFVERFVEEFRATKHELSVTFRCAEAIVEMARRLFVPAKRSQGSSMLESRSVAPGLVSVETYDTEADEATAVIAWAQNLISSGLPVAALAIDEDPRISAEHIAILARSRIQLRAILGECDRLGIPYHFSAGEAGIFDSDQFRLLLYGIRLLSNPRDIATAKTLAACVGTLLHSAQMEVRDDGSLNAVGLLAGLAKSAASTGLETPLRTLAACASKEFDVSAGMERLVAWTPSVDSDESVLADLVGADSELLRERWAAYRSVVDKDARTWQGILLEIVNRPRAESAGLRILTVHAAKGLEFRAVALVGMNEGSFPDFRNSDDESVESERRLAYVAVTRAARLLALSRPRYRMTRYGRMREQKPSRFLAMIGAVGRDQHDL